MTKQGVLFLLVAGLLIFSSAAHAIVVNLSAQEAEEAIAFGKQHHSTIEKMLGERYSFGPAAAYTENGTMHTKWHKLALLAAAEHRQGKHVTPQQQSEILSDPCLQINTTVYGHSLDFASEYRVFLIQAGKQIEPEKFHADHFSNHQSDKKPQGSFPCCRAVLRSYFKYGTFDPSVTATVMIKKDGKEIRFAIDLNQYK
jgi:hypothetical protein